MNDLTTREADLSGGLSGNPGNPGLSGNPGNPDPSPGHPSPDPVSPDHLSPGGPDDPASPPDGPGVPEDAPLTQWEDGMVSLPEDIQPDADMLAGFGRAAVAAGLTRRQAQALVDWQTAFQRDQAQARLDAGAATLRQAWGIRADANQKAVLGLVSRIDRALGDERFSRALNESGAARHADVVLGLHAVAALLSEDSLGSAAAVATHHDETALEGLQNALHELRRGRG